MLGAGLDPAPFFGAGGLVGGYDQQNQVLQKRRHKSLNIILLAVRGEEHIRHYSKSYH